MKTVEGQLRVAEGHLSAFLFGGVATEEGSQVSPGDLGMA